MTKTRKQKPAEVESLVNQYMDRHPVLKRLGAHVLPGTAQMGEWGWSVLVGTSKEPKSTFRYVSELSDVTEELLDEAELDVVLAPSTRRPTDVMK